MNEQFTMGPPNIPQTETMGPPKGPQTETVPPEGPNNRTKDNELSVGVMYHIEYDKYLFDSKQYNKFIVPTLKKIEREIRILLRQKYGLSYFDNDKVLNELSIIMNSSNFKVEKYLGYYSISPFLYNIIEKIYNYDKQKVVINVNKDITIQISEQESFNFYIEKYRANIFLDKVSTLKKENINSFFNLSPNCVKFLLSKGYIDGYSLKDFNDILETAYEYDGKKYIGINEELFNYLTSNNIPKLIWFDEQIIRERKKGLIFKEPIKKTPMLLFRFQKYNSDTIEYYVPKPILDEYYGNYKTDTTYSYPYLSNEHYDFCLVDENIYNEILNNYNGNYKCVPMSNVMYYIDGNEFMMENKENNLKR